MITESTRLQSMENMLQAIEEMKAKIPGLSRSHDELDFALPDDSIVMHPDTLAKLPAAFGVLPDWQGIPIRTNCFMPVDQILGTGSAAHEMKKLADELKNTST